MLCITDPLREHKGKGGYKEPGWEEMSSGLRCCFSEAWPMQRFCTGITRLAEGGDFFIDIVLPVQPPLRTKSKGALY